MGRPLPGVRARVRAFDAGVERRLDLIRGHPAADHLFYAASELGDFSLVWLMLGCLRGLRSGDHDLPAALRLGGGLAAESLLINGGVKSVFRRSRPVWDDRPRQIRQPLTSSFPSGHATSSFVSAVLLSERDPYWPLYWAVAAVVATSRAYVKIHHASDVVAGAVVGVGLGLVMRRLAPLPPVAPAATVRPAPA